MEFVRADHEVSEGIRGAHGARTYYCSSLGYREGSIAPVTASKTSIFYPFDSEIQRDTTYRNYHIIRV